MAPQKIGPGHYDLAYTLKDAREELGYSQTQVSKMMGIAATTYTQWENGRRTPSITTMQKICSVFQCAARVQENGWWLVDLGQIIDPD